MACRHRWISSKAGRLGPYIWSERLLSLLCLTLHSRFQGTLGEILSPLEHLRTLILPFRVIPTEQVKAIHFFHSEDLRPREIEQDRLHLSCQICKSRCAVEVLRNQHAFVQGLLIKGKFKRLKEVNFDSWILPPNRGTPSD